MKLIGMTDYVFFAQEKSNKDKVEGGFGYHILTYANFLKQPLELWMFIPCKDGKPLEEPDGFGMYDDNTPYEGCDLDDWVEDCKEYQEAKDQVLFEGFQYVTQGMNTGCVRHIDSRSTFNLEPDSKWTIEAMEEICEVTLTPNAIKQVNQLHQ